MKNTIKTFLTLFAVSLVFAGCTQNLGVVNKADKITLNGSVGINGAVPSALFNASSENSAGRTAVSSGKLYYGYSFGLAAENESTGEKVSAAFKTEFGKENEFTIKLEKAKYKLSLCIIDSENKEYSLNVTKIVLGKNISSGATLDLTDDSVDLKSEKIAVYFAPSVETGNEPSSKEDTIIMSTGQGSVNLTLKSTCTENNPYMVEYEYIRMLDDVLEITDATSGIGSTEFKGETAIINTSFPLANGVYRFTISIYDKDKNLLVTTNQTVNVFVGFVTDTWLDSGSKFLVTENGVTSFVLTDDLIKADEPEPEPEPEPNETFTVEEFEKYCEENGITKESEDFKVLEIPGGYTSINLCDYVEGRDKNPSILSYYPYLEAIIIPDTVESIQSSSFQDCKSLMRVRVNGENLKYIGWSVFNGCENLFEVRLPDSVTDIDGYTFFRCSSLGWMNLPPNLKTLSEGLFLECTNLTEIIIPEKVTKIDRRAIQDCESIIEVVVPENVKTIGCAAFWGSEKLSKIIMKPVTPPTLEPFLENDSYENVTTANGVFEWCADDLKIFVPEESVQAYRQAWPEYKDMITYEGEPEPEPAEPNTYYVRAAGYETNIVWGEGNDENSGTSPEEPLATLQAAVDKIIEINDSQTEYKISVMGTMKPTEVIVEETTSYKLADFNGLDKDVNLNVKIVGRENAVLDAEEKCSAIVVGVVGAKTNLLKVNLTLEGLEIKNGNDVYGGGVCFYCVDGCSLTIKDCKITNNTAGYYDGGGVYVYGYNTLKISDSEISNNKVSAKGYGGGVYVGVGCTAEIENCEFSNNEAELANGGVIFANYSTLTIKDCKFANNKSGHADGGAIFAYQSTLTVKGGEFTENFAYRDGGAIYLQGGQLTVDGGIITGNKATNGNGGGIYVNQNSSLEISDVTITGNTATGEGNNLYVEAGGSYTGPEFDEEGLYSGSGNVSPVYGNMSFNLVTLSDGVKGKIEVIDGVYQIPMKTDISFVLEQDGEEITPNYSSICLIEENNALPVVEGSSDSQFVLSPENAFFNLYKGDYDISKKYLLRIAVEIDFIYYDWEFEAKIVQDGTAN